MANTNAYPTAWFKNGKADVDRIKKDTQETGDACKKELMQAINDYYTEEVKPDEVDNKILSQIKAVESMFDQCLKLRIWVLDVPGLNVAEQAIFAQKSFQQTLERMKIQLTTHYRHPRIQWEHLHYATGYTFQVYIHSIDCFLNDYIDQEGELFKELVNQSIVGCARYSYERTLYTGSGRFEMVVNNLNIIFSMCQSVIDSSNDHEQRKIFAHEAAKLAIGKIHQSYKEFAIEEFMLSTETSHRSLKEKLDLISGFHSNPQEDEQRGECSQRILALFDDMRASAKLRLEMYKTDNMDDRQRLERYIKMFKYDIDGLNSLPPGTRPALTQLSEFESSVIDAHWDIIYDSLDGTVEASALTRLKELKMVSICPGGLHPLILGPQLKFLILRQVFIDTMSSYTTSQGDRGTNGKKVIELCERLEKINNFTKDAGSEAAIQELGNLRSMIDEYNKSVTSFQDIRILREDLRNNPQHSKRTRFDSIHSLSDLAAMISELISELAKVLAMIFRRQIDLRSAKSALSQAISEALVAHGRGQDTSSQ